jgi:hypothetical protein
LTTSNYYYSGEHESIHSFILANVLRIQLPKYHDNDDPIIHIQQLTKISVTNGENTNAHKLQFFLNSLTRRATNWFAKYETTHPMATWNKV